MNDYCKISGARADPAAKSRSIDFSDLSFSPPQTPKYPKSVCDKAHQGRAADADAAPHGPYPEEEGAGAGERFGVILSRNCSSASQRFRARERGGHASGGAATLQAAVRRAFSMRKPSSVTEGYRRIHDTAEDDGDGDCDANAMARQQQQEARAPRKKKGRIVRACKRIFGF